MSGLKILGDIEKPNIDHIYYNVAINNNTNANAPLVFEQYLTKPIIEDVSDWEGSIIRFVVSGQSLPVFLFQTRTIADNGTPIVLSATDYAIGTYAFTIVYNNASTIRQYTAPLKYIPQSYPLVLPLTVDNYHSMTDMINISLQTVYNEFKADFKGSTATCPVFNLTDNGQKMFFTNVNGWNSSTQPPLPPANGELQLWCNFDLYRFLSGFSTFSSVGQYSSQYVYFNGSIFYNISYSADKLIHLNNIQYYPDPNSSTLALTPTVFTEINLLADWNDALRLVWTSDKLPINNEQVPLTNTTVIGSNSFASIDTSPQQDQKSIVTDFIIPSVTGSDIYSDLIYNPQSEYRVFDFIGNSSITSIDFKLYWLDKYGNYNQYILSPKRNASLKLMFRRKYWSQRSISYTYPLNEKEKYKFNKDLAGEYHTII